MAMRIQSTGRPHQRAISVSTSNAEIGGLDPLGVRARLKGKARMAE